ncbi:hypothetical protein [Neobacillus drentensis]|uniref:hypothetical protein n=1 Tax=Neobacillus drentensis TaxID=220684 RepID=UPI002FFF1389
MFIEKIDRQLLEEIQDALEEEHNEIVASWDGEILDQENEDINDTLRSQIFSNYLNIPLQMLTDLIHQHYPFLKEKEITIDPFSEVLISENDDNKKVLLRVYADVYINDREILGEAEKQLLDKLLAELTQLYQDLDVDTTLNITQVPIEELPEEYYEDDDEDEHDFIQFEF